MTTSSIRKLSGYVCLTLCFSGIACISVLIPTTTYSKADLLTSKTWIDWIHRVTKKTYETIVQLWKWLF